MSIVQGGYGFPVLHPAVYNYIATGKYIGTTFPDVTVPDLLICRLIKEVHTAVLTNSFRFYKDSSVSK